MKSKHPEGHQMNSRMIWILIAAATIALSVPARAQYQPQYPAGPVPAVQDPIPYIPPQSGYAPPPQAAYPVIPRMPQPMQSMGNPNMVNLNMMNMLPPNMLQGQNVNVDQLMAQAMAMAQRFIQQSGILNSINNMNSLLDDQPIAPAQNYDPQVMMNQIGPAIQQLMGQVQGQQNPNIQNAMPNLGDINGIASGYLSQINQLLDE